MAEKIVKWEYNHFLNSTQSTRRVKTGIYFGKVKHTVKHWSKRGAEQMACVKFSGNKSCSIVPYAELKFL